MLIHQGIFYNELLRQYAIEYRVLVKRCEPYIKVKYADLYRTKSKTLMKYYQEFWIHVTKIQLLIVLFMEIQVYLGIL